MTRPTPQRFGGRTFDYGANRIQSVAENGRTSTYAYDDQGQRVLNAGPCGRTLITNRYYGLPNGAIATKHVFACDL